MTGFSAASRKGWETRKAMEIANGYGPKGRKRGRESHKVTSVSEILERLQGGAAVACLVHTQEVGGSSPPPATNDESGSILPCPDRTILRQAQDCRSVDGGGQGSGTAPNAAVVRNRETAD